MISIFSKNNSILEDEPEPTILSVSREYIRKPSGMQNMVIQPVLKTLKWVDFCGRELSHCEKEAKNLFGKVAHGLFYHDFHNDLRKIGREIVKLKNSLASGSLWDISYRSKKVYIKSASAADLVAGTIEIAHKGQLIHLSKFQLVVLDTIGFLGSTALFLSALSGLKKEFNKLIHAEIGSPKFNLSLIRVVGKICLLAISIFGMVTFCIGQIIAHLILLMVSTLLLICSLSGHFYEKLYVEKTVEK